MAYDKDLASAIRELLADETLIRRPNAGPCVLRGRELVGWLRVDPGGVADARSLPPT